MPFLFKDANSAFYFLKYFCIIHIVMRIKNQIAEKKIVCCLLNEIDYSILKLSVTRLHSINRRFDLIICQRVGGLRTSQ